MRDAERRAKQRPAEAGDTQAVAEVERDNARTGRGVAGFLLALVGKQVWIEGVRINYRGILLDVLFNGDGSVAGLVLHPFQRISYFNKKEPDTNYTFTHTKPHLVPYECIHDIGEEGLEGAGSGWGRLS
jgi:hypothetical protein